MIMPRQCTRISLFRKEEIMPLNKKGQKIMRQMKKEYGAKKGEQVFYASRNKGTIKGVERKR